MEQRTNFRWKVFLLILTIGIISYMDRVNLSVATPIIMQEFGMDKIDMGFLQTCFFTSYALMQVPGGMLAEKFGPRKTGAVAVTWWSIFTAATALGQGKMSFGIIRFLFGMGEGPIFPSVTLVNFKWFNPNEKGVASSAMTNGCFIGPIFGPAITVALMTTLGWHSVFILFGIVGLFLAILWYKFVPADPKDSPYVNAAELAYINEGRKAESKDSSAPWSRFLSSTQFWAIGLQYLVADYIMYVFLSWLPMYLLEAYGFSLSKMGIWASFPWIALVAVNFFAGWLSDKVAMQSGDAQYKLRVITGIIGTIICSVGLYFASITPDPTMNIIFMSISLGALGFCFNAGWASCISLGGKFSASVGGWMNFWGNVGGVLAPLVTAFLVQAYGWSAALNTTSMFGIIAIIAWLFVRPGKPLV